MSSGSCTSQASQAESAALREVKVGNADGCYQAQHSKWLWSLWIHLHQEARAFCSRLPAKDSISGASLFLRGRAGSSIMACAGGAQ